MTEHHRRFCAAAPDSTLAVQVGSEFRKPGRPFGRGMGDFAGSRSLPGIPRCNAPSAIHGVRSLRSQAPFAVRGFGAFASCPWDTRTQTSCSGDPTSFVLMSQGGGGQARFTRSRTAPKRRWLARPR